MRFHLFANRKLKLWLSSCLLFACLHVNADEPESRRSQAIKFAGRKDNVGQSRGRNMSRRRTEDRPNLDDRLICCLLRMVWKNWIRQNKIRFMSAGTSTLLRPYPKRES